MTQLYLFKARIDLIPGTPSKGNQWSLYPAESPAAAESAYKDWIGKLTDKFENDFVTLIDCKQVDKFAVPEPDGVRVVSVSDAIEHQRRAGKANNYEYPSDEQALDDFLCVHWALPVDLFPQVKEAT